MAEWIDLVAMIRDIQVHVQYTGDEILPCDHFKRADTFTNPFLPGYPVIGFVAVKKPAPELESDQGGEWLIALHNVKSSLDSLDDEGQELLDQIRSRFTDGLNSRNLCMFLNETPLYGSSSEGLLESSSSR